MGVSHVIFPQISNKMANPVPRKGIYDIRWNVLQEYFFTISENLLILDGQAIPVQIEEVGNAR